jgi:hypothetical protein
MMRRALLLVALLLASACAVDIERETDDDTTTSTTTAPVTEDRYDACHHMVASFNDNALDLGCEHMLNAEYCGEPNDGRTCTTSSVDTCTDRHDAARTCLQLSRVVCESDCDGPPWPDRS